LQPLPINHPYQDTRTRAAALLMLADGKLCPMEVGANRIGFARQGRRSRGGLTTKPPLAGDEAGRPLRMSLSVGQVVDNSCAHAWVEHVRTGAGIPDKGYDSDACANAIRAARGKVVIPPRSNRKAKRRHSRVLHRTRHIVERFFNRIKNFVASPLDTTSSRATISPSQRL
jgi:transposase